MHAPFQKKSGRVTENGNDRAIFFSLGNGSVGEWQGNILLSVALFWLPMKC